jgi:hypothetical protein
MATETKAQGKLCVSGSNMIIIELGNPFGESSDSYIMSGENKAFGDRGKEDQLVLKRLKSCWRGK